jgi:hypothetical protein
MNCEHKQHKYDEAVDAIARAAVKLKDAYGKADYEESEPFSDSEHAACMPAFCLELAYKIWCATLENNDRTADRELEYKQTMQAADLAIKGAEATTKVAELAARAQLDVAHIAKGELLGVKSDG